MKKSGFLPALLALVISFIAISAPAFGQDRRSLPPAPPDPFTLNDNIIGGTPTTYRQTAGLTADQITIDPAKKTLVLMVGGQSQGTTLQQTFVAPTTSAAVSHLNIYDGAFYPVTGPLLGTGWIPTGAPYGNGNLTVGLVNKMLARGFDRVLLVNFAVGNTEIADWAAPDGTTIDRGAGAGPRATGALYDRPSVAMRRLAALGITPATTGVTFTFVFLHGESDNLYGTAGATYTTKAQQVFDKLYASGFVGRIFMPQETWISGAASTTIRAAQAALVDNVKVFSGGDLDSLGAGNRFADLVHFNDTGAPAAATILDNAMHASGAPFYWQPPYAANDNNPWAALEGCNDNTSDLCRAM